MFELVGGLLCVNAVVGMRVVMNEISHQNTHRIQTNATCATIPQSHNPTHAHPQWREIARVHRMQKVIQPSWKSEHSYAHSHRGESTYLYSVQQVIHTKWKIEGAHIHRQCHCQCICICQLYLYCGLVCMILSSFESVVSFCVTCVENLSSLKSKFHITAAPKLLSREVFLPADYKNSIKTYFPQIVNAKTAM